MAQASEHSRVDNLSTGQGRSRLSRLTGALPQATPQLWFSLMRSSSRNQSSRQTSPSVGGGRRCTSQSAAQPPTCLVRLHRRATLGCRCPVIPRFRRRVLRGSSTFSCESTGRSRGPVTGPTQQLLPTVPLSILTLRTTGGRPSPPLQTRYITRSPCTRPIRVLWH